jgi:putative endonuclease
MSETNREAKPQADDPVVRQAWRRMFRAVETRLLGDRGERVASQHLKLQGMRVLMRGYRTRQGEVDLIARDGDVLVFVEVKTRRQGVPAEAVTPEKQRRLVLAALHFAKRHKLLDHPSRFDVVAVVWPEGRVHPQIEHIRGAFQGSGRGQMFY